MADQVLLLPDDTANTGKKLDTSQLTVGANTVQRERMQVSGDAAADLAAVKNSAPTTEYGLVTRAAGTTKVSQTDGTNTETTLFDADSGAGSQFLQGVSLRKIASGGSVEAGTSADPLRTDPTGTTTQPVSATNLDIRDLTSADVVTANLSATDNAVLDNIDADTSAIQTAVELIDDTVATLGTTTYAEATTKGLTIGAVRRDADTTLVGTTNEIGPLQMDANGRLKVEAFSGETLPVSLASTTITGTVAVTQSGTWDEVGINDSGNSITVDNAALSVTGGGVEASALRVTIANDSTGVLSVDDNGGTLTVDGTVAVSSITTSITPGTAAANLGKAEDAAHTTGDVGVMALTVRQNTAASTSGADADYQPIISNTRGAAWVAIEDGAGGQITSFGGGTQYTEDVAAAADPVGNATILVRKDTPATITTTDGDNVAQRGTNYGAAYCQIVSSAGALIDSFGGSGGTAQADRSTFTDGTTNMTPIGGVYNETDTNPTEDQAAAVRITIDRALHVAQQGSVATTGVTQVDASGGTDTNVGYDSGNLNMPTQDVAGLVDDAAFTPATSAVQMVGFEFDDATPDSVNEGDGGAARMSANRNIYTNIRDNAGNERGLNVDANGEIGIGAIRTSVTPGTAAGNLGKAEDAAHTTGDTGVMALGVRDDAPAAVSGADGDYEPLHISAEGAQWVANTPSASGGLTIFRSLDLDESEEEVKATAGAVYGLWFTNTATATRWLKFYNATAANVTVGTTTPVMTIGLPGNTSDDISGLFATTNGIAFGTAITVAATTAAADADTGAPSAGDVVLNVFYK